MTRVIELINFTDYGGIFIPAGLTRRDERDQHNDHGENGNRRPGLHARQIDAEEEPADDGDRHRAGDESLVDRDGEGPIDGLFAAVF